MRASQFQLSRFALEGMKAIAVQMQKPESEIPEIAITHLWGTVSRGQGIYITVREMEAKSRKAQGRAHRAG